VLIIALEMVALGRCGSLVVMAERVVVEFLQLRLSRPTFEGRLGEKARPDLDWRKGRGAVFRRGVSSLEAGDVLEDLVQDLERDKLLVVAAAVFRHQRERLLLHVPKPALLVPIREVTVVVVPVGKGCRSRSAAVSCL
jgi:hypothetical protein